MADVYIISDLHLGSRYSRHEVFVEWVKQLPDDATLILNGDTINHRYRKWPGWQDHEAVVQFLREESERRPIIWIRGNNDRSYATDDPGAIEFRDDYAIGKRLYIAHGHRFDRLMPRTRWLLWGISAVYAIRRLATASDMHVAKYAKRMPFLYNILCNHVAKNAIKFAAAHGYEAVTCGHTHRMVDMQRSGICYINTGAWTETPSYFVRVADTRITLESIP